MELRIQTHLFFALCTCVLFLFGCGTYQVDDDTETVESSGPYVMDVTLSNAQLFYISLSFAVLSVQFERGNGLE